MYTEGTVYIYIHMQIHNTYGTSAASLSESSCLLHESRTTTFVEEEEDTYGTSAASLSESSCLLHESRIHMQINIHTNVYLCIYMYVYV